MGFRLPELPRGLKQLEELDNGRVFVLISNNADHFCLKRGDVTRLVDSAEALSDLLRSILCFMVLIRTGVLQHKN
jgi:hypothetical protein